MFIGLHEAAHLNPHQLIVEGDFTCVIQQVTQSCSYPWFLADIMEEVIQLSGGLNISFIHTSQSANAEANHLAKEGVSKPSLTSSSFCLFVFSFPFWGRCPFLGAAALPAFCLVDLPCFVAFFGFSITLLYCKVFLSN